MALDDFDPNRRLERLARHVGDGYDPTYPLSGTPILTSEEINRTTDEILRPTLKERYLLAREGFKNKHPRTYGAISGLYRIATSVFG